MRTRRPTPWPDTVALTIVCMGIIATVVSLDLPPLVGALFTGLGVFVAMAAARLARRRAAGRQDE